MYEDSCRCVAEEQLREAKARRWAFEFHMGDLHTGLAREHYDKAERYVEGGAA